jgi:hypothetical protein
MADEMTATDGTADLRARVVALEQWRIQRDIDSARHDERWKSMDEKIDAVGKKVDKISDGLSRIMWTFIVAVILAFVAFVVKGGLAP